MKETQCKRVIYWLLYLSHSLKTCVHVARSMQSSYSEFGSWPAAMARIPQRYWSTVVSTPVVFWLQWYLGLVQRLHWLHPCCCFVSIRRGWCCAEHLLDQGLHSAEQGIAFAWCCVGTPQLPEYPSLSQSPVGASSETPAIGSPRSQMRSPRRVSLWTACSWW